MLPIQERLLVLLKEMDNICRKYDIQWFLMYGTLLGAIRHQGFIPWDDDADIVMTHENWVKFKQAFENDPVSGRKLTSIDIDASQYGQVMARYHDMTQEVLLKYNTIYNMENGVYVDILIIDNYPDDKNSREEYHQTFLDYCELAHKRYCPTSYLPGKSQYLKKIWKFLLNNRQKELNKYINKLSSLGKSDSTTLIQRYCINHRYPREVLAEAIYVPFEDTMLPVPRLYYEALCLQYGESWMYVPENHITHDDNILSHKKSAGRSIVQQFHEKRKGFFHELLYFLSKIANNFYFPLYKKWKLDSRKPIIEYVRNNASDRNTEDRILQYLAYQTDVWFVGRYVSQNWWNWYNHNTPMLIDVDDQLLEDSLFFLLEHDCSQLACMLFQAIEFSERKTTKRLTELGGIISGIKQATALFYYGKYQESISIVDNMLESLPDNIMLWRLKISAAYHNSPIEYSLCNERISSHIIRDAEVAYIQAELSFRARDIKTCIHHMMVCASGTRNGMVLHKLVDLIARVAGVIRSEAALETHFVEKIRSVHKAAISGLGRELEEEKLFTELFGQENSCGNASLVEGPFASVSWQSPISAISSAECIPAGEEQSNIGVDQKAEEEAPSISAPILIGDFAQKEAGKKLHKQAELVDEFTKLCEACGVRYYLFGNTLRFAMENAYPYAQNVRLSVAVDARECRKLIKFYKNHIKKDRYIESLLDNPDFPEFALYYGSDETTEFNVNQFGFLKHYGIFIVIRVLSLQYTSSIGRKIRMMAEEGWALAHGRVGGSVSRFLAYFCISICRLLFGKKRTAKWIFTKLVLRGKRVYSKDDNYHLYWKKKFLSLPVKWFFSSSTLIFNGSKYQCPSKDFNKNILNLLYGKRWSPSHLKDKRSIDPFVIDNTEYRNKDFLEKLSLANVDINDLWKSRIFTMHLSWIRSVFLYPLTSDWNFLLFLNERYRMYAALLPYKKKLMQILSTGVRSDIEKMIQDPVWKECFKITEDYALKNLCFNFDSQIFNFMLDEFRNRKNIKLAKKLVSLNKCQKYNKIGRKDVVKLE